MPTAKTPNTTTAVALPMLTDDEITRALRAGGVIEQASQTNRIKVDGAMFIAGEDMFPYNAAKPEPAFFARLVGPLRQYQGFYFDEDNARYANRPDIQDKFCKSYSDIPEQARKVAEDGTNCRDCPVNPFVSDPPFGKKCSWRGELELQIIPESGQLTGDEPVWLLDFSTTSVIEFVGTKKAPTAGHVSPYNFMHNLAKLAATQAAQSGDDPGTAVLRAIDSYNRGGVVGGFRLLGASSTDGSMKWRVISVEPIQIIDLDPEPEAPALEAGQASDAYEAGDPGNADLPF